MARCLSSKGDEPIEPPSNLVAEEQSRARSKLQQRRQHLRFYVAWECGVGRNCSQEFVARGQPRRPNGSCIKVSPEALIPGEDKRDFVKRDRSDMTSPEGDG